MGAVAVIGLGPSVDLYKNDYVISIGVNDIWRKVHTDAIVCLDRQRVFNSDRLGVINASRPHAFYSQIVQWDTRPDFKYINLLPGYPDRHIDLHADGYYKSFCSPFVAVQIARKIYEADEIHLFGVDMNNHPHLNGDILKKIRLHFRNLKAALEKEGCRMVVFGTGILTELF